MSQCIYSKGGSRKYVLDIGYKDKLHFGSPKEIYTQYGVFLKTGLIIIKGGYEWDGPSGPAIDTDNFMDGALVHDFLYQLMREGHLNRWRYRRQADKEMRIQCKRDGMSFIRRWYTWAAVRVAGHRASGGKLLWD